MFERCVEMCVDIAAAPGSIPDHEYKPAFDRGANVWRAAVTAEKYGLWLA